jgi:hypothetical protein
MAQKGVTTRRPSATPAPVLTAAGVIILATISAFSFWFGASIGLIGLINEPYGTFREGPVIEDYFSGGRVFLGVLGAAVLTGLTWAGALMMADR